MPQLWQANAFPGLNGNFAGFGGFGGMPAFAPIPGGFGGPAPIVGVGGGR
jgi:hypothetical protein